MGVPLFKHSVAFLRAEGEWLHCSPHTELNRTNENGCDQNTELHSVANGSCHVLTADSTNSSWLSLELVAARCLTHCTTTYQTTDIPLALTRTDLLTPAHTMGLHWKSEIHKNTDPHHIISPELCVLLRAVVLFVGLGFTQTVALALEGLGSSFKCCTKASVNHPSPHGAVQSTGVVRL